MAGRLSHETFMHRVDQVFATRRQADLPPLVADLPAVPPGGRLLGWVRGTWSRVRGARVRGAGDPRDPQALANGGDQDAGQLAMPRDRRPVRVTSSMSASPDRRQPHSLQFPRSAGDRFTIGRDATCDLAIADMTVSRQHAQLERTPEGWLLSDLESTNGTRVNGWRVRGQVPVGPGDLVSFGNLEVVFTD